MAALVQSLYFAGSRLSDGAPNDTGTVYAYIPGTVSPATLYADADATVAITQPITLDAGGRIPYATYPDGVWITAPVRLLVQDVDGNTVSDAPFWPADARDTALVNDGFTGDTVDDALSALYASTGGTDANYLESGGATNRPIQDKFREVGVSVADFANGVGNGVNINTTAFQSAINRCKVLSANLIVPPGEYIVDQAITATDMTGVRVIGSGQGSTTITTTHGSASVFSFTDCTDVSVENMTIVPILTSSGAAIYFEDTIRPSVINVTAGATSHDFGWGVAMTGVAAQHHARIDGCYFTGTTAAVSLTNIIHCYITNTQMNNLAGTALFLSGAAAAIGVANCGCAATSGVVFDTGATGTLFTILSSPTLGTNTTTHIDMSALTTDPGLYQWGNRVDGYTENVAAAGTMTPNRAKGPQIRVRATGATATVAAPTPTPGTTMYDVYLEIDVFNDSGGASTVTLDAVYHTSAGPSTTNGNHTFYRFKWDPSSSVWREQTRAVTT